MSHTSIQEEIFRLSSADRAMLIEFLWESLDKERITEIEAKWAAESEDRIDAVDRGELTTLDGTSALGDLRSAFAEMTAVALTDGYRRDPARCKIY